MSHNVVSGLRTDGRTDSESLLATVEDIDADPNETIELSYGFLRALVEQVVSNSETEDELEELREHSAQDRAEIRKDVSEVREAVEEDDSPGVDPGGETADSATQSPETPLEDVVALPEYLAGDQLSANQERARFVARDIRDYCQKVRAGFVISATDLRRVLAAKEEETKIHRKTAHRVMDWLAKLGEANGIEVVKKRGTKQVVFPADQVDRLAEFGKSANVTSSSRPEAPEVSR